MAREQRERTDDLSSVVRAALTIAKRRLASAVTDASVTRAVTSAHAATNKSHKREFYRRLSQVVGTDVLATEGFTAKVTRSWVSENVKKIRSLRGEVIDACAKDIDAAFRSGLRHEELAKRWREKGLPVEFGTVEGRARVIARDQIASLNGRLTEERQRNVGIERYTWQASGDERVRDSHEALDGTVRSWDDSPRPGEETLCRCVAIAFVDVEALAERPNVQLAESPSFAQPLAAAAR
jgi:SPP1 gp7 family putative phage head morphogenesis protein